MPKKLSEKEKKRREEMKRLKDVENLEKIQKKLFKDRPGKNNKINPIKKQEITNYENAFLKECREVFSKDNKSISKASLNTTKNNEKEKEKEKEKNKNSINSSRLPSRQENKSKNNNDDNNTMRITHEKIEIECDIDAPLDEKFLKNLKDEDRDFYENQTGEVFNLLKSINLARFIEKFI